jgi:hypothetical protein
MTLTSAMPIDSDWTTTVPATSAALAARLGQLDVDALASWRRAIAAAASEIADAAGRPWPYGCDPPLVPLLRALGRLAAAAPDVTSRTAGALLDAIDAELRDRSAAT